MNRLITSSVGGFPLVLDDLRFVWGQGDNAQGIYQALNNLLRNFGEDFIVQGAEESSGNIAEGWVILDGELFKVDAHNRGSNTHYSKVITFDDAGDKIFQNGTSAQTYQLNRAVVNVTSGNLPFNGIRIFKTDKRFADGTETTIVTRKKIIDIGDWDMDTDFSISVTHGISDFKKIRSMEAIIINDSDTERKLLTATDTLGTALGNVVTANATIISLSRLTGGFFDSAAFITAPGSPPNRGFVTVIHEL